MDKKECVYFVSTPIGNLGDITLRALEILRSVDFIACEDTRHSLKLLNHYEISKPLIAYHKFNESTACETIIERVCKSQSCAVISDAGTPLVCDPGNVLVKRLIQEKINFYCIPGANAFLPALSYCGFDFTSFTFYGFLSDKKSLRTKELSKILLNEYPTVIYLPPHDAIKILKEISNLDPNRNLSLSREITKIHEGTIRGNAQSIISLLPDPVKGEIVLVIDKKEISENIVSYDDKSVEDLYEKYLNQTGNFKLALKELSSETGIPKRDLYDKFKK